MHHTYGRASGIHRDDCWHLAFRGASAHAFEADEGDSWICRSDQGELRTCVKKAGLLTSIWAGPKGSVFATDAEGFVYSGPAAQGVDWPAQRLSGTLTGVFGVDDEHVYVWGQSGGTTATFYSRKSDAWESLPAPPEPILALHGHRPDFLVGVGEKGSINRWDGSSWHAVGCPTSRTLNAVYVDEEGTIYAGGMQGDLIHGSSDGCEVLMPDAGPVASLAMWRDALWVGTLGEKGLCRWAGKELESLKPNIAAVSLEANDVLLFSTQGFVGDTVDGKQFMACFVRAFETAVANEPPLWK